MLSVALYLLIIYYKEYQKDYQQKHQPLGSEIVGGSIMGSKLNVVGFILAISRSSSGETTALSFFP